MMVVRGEEFIETPSHKILQDCRGLVLILQSCYMCNFCIVLGAVAIGTVAAISASFQCCLDQYSVLLKLTGVLTPLALAHHHHASSTTAFSN